jgi:hypothetical protein
MKDAKGQPSLENVDLKSVDQPLEVRMHRDSVNM